MKIEEPPRETPVVDEVDVCVIGGSCTGVFAAVRAARRGLKVCIVEALGRFGGTATARMVNVWHSTWNLEGTQRVVGGLSLEVIERLDKRKAVMYQESTNPNWEFCFNAAELSLELDELIKEHDIRPFLHARLVGSSMEGQTLKAVFIEDKSGRRAIRARCFVDASGDADLLRRSGVKTEKPEVLQPPTTAAIVHGIGPGSNRELHDGIYGALLGPGGPEVFKKGFIWAAPVPGCDQLKAIFGTRVHGVDCADADDLTRAEMEGRSQVRIMVDRLREVNGEGIGLAALPCAIGVRDTGRILAEHRLEEMEVLEGVDFPDAIAHGTYRVDIHQQGGAGLIFRYLDGRELISSPDRDKIEGRWREEREQNPPYSIPYRSLVPLGVDNVIAAGRCLCADEGAYGAVRVMILCNQTGEAAGEAAAQFSRENLSAYRDVDTQKLREALNEGGSLIQPMQESLAAMPG